MACAIKLDKFVVITGGLSSKTLVSKYDMNGWMKDLASLNTGRYGHGCGFYYRDTNELVRHKIQIIITFAKKSAVFKILTVIFF